MYKNYIKSILIFIFIILLFSIINTSLYYFNVTNNIITNIIEIITILVSSFISGFYIGKKSKNKGYINGIILSVIIIVLLLILNIIISRNINIISIIYYLGILLIVTISSIIGINKKSKQ
ncbi:MAG: TIGR04086 family membrane protein [Bacilli bacterium]|nr:TIGR04086 family membrane protein [Bacilli bacterium]